MTPPSSSPAVSFFYGDQPPWSELQAFDLVVVDPDHVKAPKAVGLKHTRLAAYVSLGEVQPSRPYSAKIPAAWLVGKNKTWGSRLIDQSQPEWPLFFTNNVIAPLWDAGYRTFFLDTLDSYQLFAKTAPTRAAQEAGLVAVLQAVTTRYPDIKLIFNRGFEILPQTHQLVEMVVAESLFQGFDAGKHAYTVVKEEDRAWLLTQLRQANETYQLPIVVIDYVPTAERELARTTAQRIKDLGFIPWVATSDLVTVGVGAIEVMPRRVAVIHNVLKDEYALRGIAPLRVGAMPLQYLGYIPEYFDTKHLPNFSLPGRYAGVLVWLSAPPSSKDKITLQTWLEKQLSEHLPIAVLGSASVMTDGLLGKKLGISIGSSNTISQAVEVTYQDDMMGYERDLVPQSDDFFPLTVQSARPLLSLKRGTDTQMAAALTPWGGYALSPYDLTTLPGDTADRWIINPFAFFKKALHLPDMPVPDVTTESGRRMLMVHMDGDGFISRSELPGNPLAGELVRDRVVKKYPVPMTISVIEAEISPTGLYPGLSALAEQTAKDIFQAPHVAIASHSYSHPFSWANVADGNEGDYNLRLPGYQFSLQREIEGSIRYIDEQLAPPGKKVSMFFWTGNCLPGSDALAWTYKMGVLNINGGDTVATRSSPTMTDVEGLGIPRQGGYQVFAPNQNENVYTNGWHGPFYGFERVIETFELTESPRRLKPIDIYFHTYITTKAAGMKSLDKVFSYALSQENTPVQVADYARKVLDFQDLAIARTSTGWRVRGAQDLRTLRMPASMGTPDITQSQSVAGYNSYQDQVYAHLSADEADLVLNKNAAQDTVRLVSANGQVTGFERVAQGYRWNLNAYVPLKFTLANAQNCQVRIGDRLLSAKRQAKGLSFFEIQDHVARPLETLCRG